MKVLHLLATNRFSGAENVVCQIINMFADDSAMEMVYCSPDGPIRDALADKGVPFLPLEKLSISQVKKAIKEFKPDIVHAHDVKAGLLAALCCGKTKLISHMHVNNTDARGISLKTLLYSVAARKAFHIFWVSQSAYDDFPMKNVVAHKSTVLKNVIDIQALCKRCEQDENTYDYDIAYVGRICAQKDPIRLMKLLRLAVDKKPDLRIAVAGTGDMEAEMKEKWQELGLQKQVSLLGFVQNPCKLLATAKVMVMSSVFEGTPMVALEAMALGVPIVSTPVDGMCDLIENDFNGFLCSDDETFASRVVEICTEDDLQQRLSNNTQERAAKLNDIAVYREALNRQYEA